MKNTNRSIRPAFCTVRKMVSLKFLAVACVLLVAQAQASPQPRLNNVVVDLLKRLTLRLEKRFTEILDIANKLVTDAITDPQKFQQDIIQLASSRLDSLLERFNARLDNVKKAGDKNTAKLIDCMESGRNPGKIAALNFLGSVTKCGIPLMEPLLKSVADLGPYVQSLKSDLFKAADGIQYCAGSDSEQVQCAIGVFKNSLSVVLQTPREVLAKMADALSEAVKFVRAAHPTCVVSNVPAAKEEFIKVVDSVAYCIIH
nr:uncharacterized protein LOC111506887 [Leptinotarsa decemlineata]